MEFHRAALALLQRPSSSPSPHAEVRLDGAERRLGRSLPAAVRAWYQLDPDAELLRLCSNQDRFFTLEELGSLDCSLRGELNRNLMTHEMLLVAEENQCVVSWAVRLDAGPNPPVLVTWGQGDEPTGWLEYARSFTEFVFSWIWDWQYSRSASEFVVVLNEPDGVPAILERHFSRQVDTANWPVEHVHTCRFGSALQRIAYFPDPKRKSSQIHLSAPDAGQLDDLKTRLRHIGLEFRSLSERAV